MSIVDGGYALQTAGILERSWYPIRSRDGKKLCSNSVERYDRGAAYGSSADLHKFFMILTDLLARLLPSG